MVLKGELVKREALLPRDALKTYGCQLCDWAHTGACSNLDWRGLSRPHKHGICAKRRTWLLANTPEYKERPSLARWRQDLNQAINHKRALAYLKYHNRVLRELEELKKSGEGGDVGLLERQAKESLDKADELMSNVQKYDDSQLYRDTPKKLDSRTINVSAKPSDVAQYIHESIADKEKGGGGGGLY